MNDADTKRPLNVHTAGDIKAEIMKREAISTVYYYPDEVGTG